MAFLACAKPRQRLHLPAAVVRGCPGKSRLINPAGLAFARTAEPRVCDTMRMMRLISSPFDGLPDAVREFLGRRALEAAGAVADWRLRRGGARARELVGRRSEHQSRGERGRAQPRRLSGRGGFRRHDADGRSCELGGLDAAAALGVAASLAATKLRRLRRALPCGSSARSPRPVSRAPARRARVGLCRAGSAGSPAMPFSASSRRSAWRMASDGW